MTTPARTRGGAAFVCNGCGCPGHMYRDCNKTAHPDFNSSKLAWALFDVGKRLATAGKTHIGYDRGDAGGKKPWEKKKKSGMYLTHDLPFLAALRAPDTEYLIVGLLRGASTDITNTYKHTDPLSVQVLLDTGAVMDNYCSKAVGKWVRLHFPKCWNAGTNTEPVNLACNGTVTEPLGRCTIDLILKKDNGSDACVLEKVACTIIDLGVDIIIGRPTILREHIARTLPDYF
jgi:hypothetical protein